MKGDMLEGRLWFFVYLFFFDVFFVNILFRVFLGFIVKLKVKGYYV